MGTRITAFAVDCVGLTRWLSCNIGDTLFYIMKHAVGEPRLFSAYDASSRNRFAVSDQRHVLQLHCSEKTTLTPALAKQIPFLNQSLETLFRNNEPLTFKFFLDSVAACPEEAWARVLTDGHPPGWIFSLLHGARAASIPPEDLADLEILCARILRGFQYPQPVYQLTSYDQSPDAGALPVLPREDMDTKMSVFLPADLRRWFELTNRVVQSVQQFKSPLAWADIKDKEMDDWVRSNVSAVNAMRDLPMQEPRMVTFIG